MVEDVIWIVTEVPLEEAPDAGDSGTPRDGQGIGNPFPPRLPTRPGGVRSVPVSAAKLEQGVTEFLAVVGRVFRHAQTRAGELAGMELDEIELSVEINGEGQLSLLGSGGKVGGKGAMTLRFKMATPNSPLSPNPSAQRMPPQRPVG